MHLSKGTRGHEQRCSQPLNTQIQFGFPVKAVPKLLLCRRNPQSVILSAIVVIPRLAVLTRAESHLLQLPKFGLMQEEENGKPGFSFEYFEKASFRHLLALLFLDCLHL